jgi:hypothetical protein
LGKRRENLEGLWGELASSFTNLGVSREATLLTHSLQPTDETLYENPSCDGISWILRFALNSLREDRERGTKLWPEKKAQYQKMTPSEKAE